MDKILNTYRVDRVSGMNAPCGMNSILFIGDNQKQANKVFEDAEIGLDWWDKPNSLYGVALSIWNPEKREYVIKRVKGLNQ